MNQHVSKAVVVPAAPRDDIADTVDSVLHFEPDALVVVVNDRDCPLKLDPRAVVLPPLPWPRDTGGGLWCKEAYGFEWVLQNSNAQVILRLDADAVVVRSGSFDAAVQRFGEAALVGALGSFRVKSDGSGRSFVEAAKIIDIQCGMRGFRFPRARKTVRDLRRSALRHGYEPGAHALGAATFLRREMLEAWQVSGWLRAWELARTPIIDDFLMGLLTYAAGFKIGEMGGPGGVVAMSWRGLPASPEQILASGACITHSVRSYADFTEEEIRRYFKAHRTASAPAVKDREPDSQIGSPRLKHAQGPYVGMTEARQHGTVQSR